MDNFTMRKCDAERLKIYHDESIEKEPSAIFTKAFMIMITYPSVRIAIFENE